jgi:hypothetical protein
MNKQHYFQSQQTEDSAHLGSIHAHAAVKTQNNNQRHDAVKPSHNEIAERAYNLFSASGYIPGHDVEHWLQAEAQISVSDDSGDDRQVERCGGTSQAAAPPEKPSAKHGVLDGG